MQDLSNQITYGRVVAQQNDGRLEAYKNQLLNLKETTRTSSVLEHQNLLNKISVLNQKIVGFNGEIINRFDPNNGTVKLMEDEIKKLNSHIFEIENDPSRAEKYSTFNLSRLIIYVAFMIPLSFYLIFFYTAISKSVFNGLNPESIINGSNISLPILPDFRELRDALSSNFLLILVPFVFFGFGLGLHIVTESKNKNKAWFVAAIIAIILIGDSAMAYKVHAQALLALNMIMDEADIGNYIALNWFLDINFYIVLILGFVVFGIWSIIFHAILVEWSKRNVIRVLMSQIRELEEKIHKAKVEVGDYRKKIDLCEKELADLNSQSSPNEKKLIETIESFTTGWLDFIRSKDWDDKDARIRDIVTYKQSYLENLAESVNHL